MLEPVDPDEPIGPDTKLRASEAGGEFLFVAGVLTSWLRQRPDGPWTSTTRPCRGVADVEAAFGLALPLLRLPADASGACSLAVRLDPEVSDRLAGVTAEVEAGRIAAVEAGLDDDADARAEASAADWLDTLIEPGVERVRIGGDRVLAGLLLDRLHSTLLVEPMRAAFGDSWPE